MHKTAQNCIFRMKLNEWTHSAYNDDGTCGRAHVYSDETLPSIIRFFRNGGKQQLIHEKERQWQETTEHGSQHELNVEKSSITRAPHRQRGKWFVWDKSMTGARHVPASVQSCLYSLLFWQTNCQFTKFVFAIWMATLIQRWFTKRWDFTWTATKQQRRAIAKNQKIVSQTLNCFHKNR